MKCDERINDPQMKSNAVDMLVERIFIKFSNHLKIHNMTLASQDKHVVAVHQPSSAQGGGGGCTPIIFLK